MRSAWINNVFIKGCQYDDRVCVLIWSSKGVWRESLFSLDLERNYPKAIRREYIN